MCSRPWISGSGSREMGNKTVPEIALTFCLERVFRKWHRDRASQWSLKDPPQLEGQGGESLARQTQLLPTGQVVERRELHRENSGDLGGDPLKVSRVLISVPMSKLCKTKGKNYPEGLEVTLPSTPIRPGIMPVLRWDCKVS